MCAQWGDGFGRRFDCTALLSALPCGDAALGILLAEAGFSAGGDLALGPTDDARGDLKRQGPLFGSSLGGGPSLSLGARSEVTHSRWIRFCHF